VDIAVHAVVLRGVFIVHSKGHIGSLPFLIIYNYRTFCLQC